MLLRNHQDIAFLARVMAVARPRHVGALLLDSQGTLVSYMFFPLAPNPQALIAGAKAASIGRLVVCFVRTGESRASAEECALAARMLQGARFFQIHLEALVVTPEAHEALIQAKGPPRP